MSGIGHNNGPTMEGGEAWRRQCWSKARADLLPTLPIEVVRLRVKRAAELGLDYKTYASVRATSGRDVIALLFSTNALCLIGGRTRMPEDRRSVLEGIRSADLLGLVQPPHAPADILAANPELRFAERAPRLVDSWSAMREKVSGAIRRAGHPADGVLIVGDTELEREWCAAARAAGYLPAERYFSGNRPRT